MTPLERSLVEEANRRYATDPEFHARVYMAVKLIDKVDCRYDEPEDFATRAASLALVLAERPIAELIS
jgi:hypothetical protein